MFFIWDKTVFAELISTDQEKVLGEVLVDPTGLLVSGERSWFAKERCVFFDTVDEAAEYARKNNIRTS